MAAVKSLDEKPFPFDGNYKAGGRRTAVDLLAEEAAPAAPAGPPSVPVTVAPVVRRDFAVLLRNTLVAAYRNAGQPLTADAL